MEHLLSLNQAFYALSAVLQANPDSKPLTLVIGTSTRTGLTPKLEITQLPDEDNRNLWRLTVPGIIDLAWTSTDMRTINVYGRQLEKLGRVDWIADTYTMRIRF